LFSAGQVNRPIRIACAWVPYSGNLDWEKQGRIHPRICCAVFETQCPYA
jgi:hypothetical protein